MSWGPSWDDAYDSALSAGMTPARATEAANARADAGKRTYPDSRSGPGNGGPPKWRKGSGGGGRTGHPGGAFPFFAEGRGPPRDTLMTALGTSTSAPDNPEEAPAKAATPTYSNTATTDGTSPDDPTCSKTANAGDSSPDEPTYSNTATTDGTSPDDPTYSNTTTTDGTSGPKCPMGTSGASGCVVPTARASARAPVVVHLAPLDPSGLHRESISDISCSTSPPSTSPTYNHNHQP